MLVHDDQQRRSRKGIGILIIVGSLLLPMMPRLLSVISVDVQMLLLSASWIQQFHWLALVTIPMAVFFVTKVLWNWESVPGDSASVESKFGALGWWTVPVGAIVGAAFPLLTRTGRALVVNGSLDHRTSAGFAIVGACAAALLTARRRIQNFGNQALLMIIGTPVIAIAAVVLLSELL